MVNADNAMQGYNNKFYYCDILLFDFVINFVSLYFVKIKSLWWLLVGCLGAILMFVFAELTN